MKPALWGCLLVVALSGCAVRHRPGIAPEAEDYGTATSCERCHRRVYVQHRFSQHQKAYEDPLFQAQLYGQLVPAAARDPRLAGEAKSCLSCHSPVTWLQGGRALVPQGEVLREYTSVTCDFCHTMTGFRGESPGNANYLVQPGDLKFGPQSRGADWHHAYLELQTRAEFCGVCHEGRNSLGVETISTYNEWKASDYARKGVQCQDCHMSARGYLLDGARALGSGAAESKAGAIADPATVFSHRFPGAHSASQLTGAMQVAVRDRPGPLAPGEKLIIEVQVSNSRAGHKMPTGSAELRLLWLEVHVGLSEDAVSELVPATPTMPERPLDVAGASPFDREVLGVDVPAGARLYRAVYADADGKQTLESWRAALALFDSRLESGEVRTERFEYTVPAGVREGDRLNVEASLKYLTAPSAYLGQLGLPAAVPAVMATDTGLLGAPADERELRGPGLVPP